ncbi:hypothetical protein ACQSSU_20780 [Micromonospora echinospora]
MLGEYAVVAAVTRPKLKALLLVSPLHHEPMSFIQWFVNMDPYRRGALLFLVIAAAMVVALGIAG